MTTKMRIREVDRDTLRNAKRYLKLREKYYENPRIAVENIEYQVLSAYFAGLRWSESSVKRFVRESLAEARATLAEGNRLLHGEEVLEL